MNGRNSIPGRSSPFFFFSVCAVQVEMKDDETSLGERKREKSPGALLACSNVFFPFPKSCFDLTSKYAVSSWAGGPLSPFLFLPPARRCVEFPPRDLRERALGSSRGTPLISPRSLCPLEGYGTLPSGAFPPLVFFLLLLLPFLSYTVPANISI